MRYRRLTEMTKEQRDGLCKAIYNILLVLIFITLGIGLVCLIAMPVRYYHQRHAVMIDAGSVHTSVYAYEYPSAHPINDTVGKLREVFSCEISSTVGISTLDKHHLEEFLFGSDCIERMYNQTEIEPGKALFIIGGTAGMRQLQEKNKTHADEIITKLEHVLEQDCLNGSEAKILSSSDEGVYGWLSANYLLKGVDIDNEHQVGSLDWGGGSSEITFASSRPSPMVNEIKLFNKTLDIFSRSDECFGQSEAIRRYLTLLFLDYHKQDADGPIEAPCQPLNIHFNKTFGEIFDGSCTIGAKPDFNETTDYQDNEYDLPSKKYNAYSVLQFIGTADHEKCKASIEQLFEYDDCMDTFGQHCFEPMTDELKRPEEFYAFSTYYYTGNLLGLNPQLDSNQLESQAKDLCSQAYENHPMKEHGEDVVRDECFRSVFMSILIKDGYGFDTNKTSIRVVSTVKNQNVGWTLGYALVKAQGWKLGEYHITTRDGIITFCVCVTLIIGGFLHNNKEAIKRWLPCCNSETES